MPNFHTRTTIDNCQPCSAISCPLMKDFLDYLTYELARSPHTVRAYRQDLTQFEEFCRRETGDFEPGAIGPPLIRRWISTLATSGEAPASLRRKTQSLRAYFRFLCRRGLLTANPADDIILAKLPKPLPDFVADADLKRLLAATACSEPETSDQNALKDSHENAPRAEAAAEDSSRPEAAPEDLCAARDHLILHMLYATGLRLSEILSLTDASISTSLAQLRVVGKRRKERIVPLAGPLLEEIARWQTLRDEAFPDLPAPRPIIATRHGAMSPSNLEKIVKRLLQNENAGRKSPHTLRHTFATSMLNGGADLNSVRAILGHSSLATTQIYTHLRFSDLQDVYAHAHPRAQKPEGDN